MEFISLDVAKAYLRIDSCDEDQLIELLGNSAEKLCIDVARLSDADLEDLRSVELDDGGNVVYVNSDKYTARQAVEIRELMRIAALYALGYLFEHREEGDHHALVKTLRCILFSIREGVV